MKILIIISLNFISGLLQIASADIKSPLSCLESKTGCLNVVQTFSKLTPNKYIYPNKRPLLSTIFFYKIHNIQFYNVYVSSITDLA